VFDDASASLDRLGVIDVAFTPAQLRPADVAVVIDVLRATSTATQALAAGYQRVLCTDTVEGAHALRRPGRVLAGERGGVMPPGFDQGNSPEEAARVAGDDLVLATTNGAPAIVGAARQAGAAVIACLLNLEAVLEVLEDEHSELLIVCSGTDGAPALEDVYVAGRISGALGGPRTDAALIAEAVARGHRDALEALAASADAAALRAVGLERDIVFCAQESLLTIVPRAFAAQDGVAVIVPGDGAAAVACDEIDADDAVSA
jgi:2-phosphosulfolactate phosphatase